MSYPIATIRSTDDRLNAFIARKVLLSSKDYRSSASGSGDAGQGFPGFDDKPFFITWLDQWKKRNQVSK
jgi:hypothetical protein